MSYGIKELREMTDEQIIKEHDDLAQQTSHNNLGLNYFINELQRREQNRQTETMLLYTRRMLWLTVFVALLTAVNVFAVFIPLFFQ